MSDLVQFENTVAMHIKQNNLINEVTEIITKIPNYEKLKFHPELLAEKWAEVLSGGQKVEKGRTLTTF